MGRRWPCGAGQLFDLDAITQSKQMHQQGKPAHDEQSCGGLSSSCRGHPNRGLLQQPAFSKLLLMNEVIVLSDDESVTAPRRKKPRPSGTGPPEVRGDTPLTPSNVVVLDDDEVDPGPASAATASQATAAATSAAGAGAPVRITIDLCDKDDASRCTAIDLTGDDDVLLASKLQHALNGTQSQPVDLAALHAARRVRVKKEQVSSVAS